MSKLQKIFLAITNNYKVYLNEFDVGSVCLTDTDVGPASLAAFMLYIYLPDCCNSLYISS